MAIVTTPLGFQKPDGNDPVRNGDNVIATNAQKAEDLIASLQGQIWYKGYLTNGTDLNALPDTGRWAIRLPTDVSTMLNIPTGAGPGFFEQTTAANGMKMQTWVNYASNTGWRRTTASVTSGSFTAWGSLDVDAKAYTDTGLAADRARLTTAESTNTTQDTRLTGVESKNSTQDTTLSNHETRVSSLETLGGLAPGSVTDATVTDLVANASSNTTAALKGKYVSKGDIYINAKDYGVIGDGVADDTASLNSAAATAYGVSPKATLYIPDGVVCKTTGKVSIRCNLRASGATINYTGTGDALVIGDDTGSNLVTFEASYYLPSVYNKSRVTGWDGTSVGIRLVNLNACKVWNTRIQDFETGLMVYGKGGGCVYNDISLGHLIDNHVNLRGDADSSGWSNQNNYYGGRLEVTSAKGSVYDDVNCVSVMLTSASVTAPANNNTFYGVSLEADRYQYYRIDVAGRYNTFVNCRFESAVGATPRVCYRSTSSSNLILNGYDSWKIVEVWDNVATGPGGTIQDGVGGNYRQISTAGQVIPTAVNTTIVWPNTGLARIAYDGAGNFTPRVGTWRIKARAAFAANATGTRKLLLACGGSVKDIDERPAVAATQSMMVSATFKFDGTKTFNVQAYQNSGADLALNAFTPYVNLEAEYLGY